MTSIQKTVEREIEKWKKINSNIKVLNACINSVYVALVDNRNFKKENFTHFHYLKMKKHYLNLKIYHFNIKHLSSSNEKLMFYLENILIKKGFNLE